MDKLGEVVREGCHFNIQAPPNFDILVEPSGEVGCGVLGSSGAGKSDLHGVEVPDAPR